MRCQGEQLARAVGRCARVAGAQKVHPPAPLRRIGTQPEFERRILFQQQLGQHRPDGRVGQRLHVGIAQLRAVATARPGGRVRGALHHGDAITGLLQHIGAGKTCNARAHDADMRARRR
ncbi:hypothetical protein SDC9_129982 [bioreactor metagenome]|uniref:Uncharacterized protein n=1 Tax=bioreactor metagenome TaxID=1076179 RepID=A0A645D0A0_9ZZZZ